jgi:hypothetical protein
VCTRWGQDPFARGAYSHIAVGASGTDYDALAAPVSLSHVSLSSSLSTVSLTVSLKVSRRLFFAGDQPVCCSHTHTLSHSSTPIHRLQANHYPLELS